MNEWMNEGNNVNVVDTYPGLRKQNQSRCTANTQKHYITRAIQPSVIIDHGTRRHDVSAMHTMSKIKPNQPNIGAIAHNWTAPVWYKLVKMSAMVVTNIAPAVNGANGASHTSIGYVNFLRRYRANSWL
jgi:hypothetical protein